jgi:CheY-like chemotaxis protein
MLWFSCKCRCWRCFAGCFRRRQERSTEHHGVTFALAATLEADSEGPTDHSGDAPRMSEQIAVALIKIIPTLVWAGVLVFALLFFRGSIVNLFPRLKNFKAFGVEASFIEETLEEASKVVPVGDDRARSAVARRAARLSTIVKGIRVLIVNDAPDEMKFVTRLLASMEFNVTIARTSQEGIDVLRQGSIDLVISDMSRDGVQDEGMRFLLRAIELRISRPTIFTVGNFQPDRGTPPYAFAITNKVDELIHYVLDIAERLRS